jgi:uncharacterized protein with WD repeat
LFAVFVLSPQRASGDQPSDQIQEVATLNGHGDGVSAIAFSPNGQLMASGSYDGTVKLWNVERRREIATLTGRWSADVFAVAFSPDGKLVASGDYDKTVKLWDVERQTEITALKGHGDGVSAVAFSPDGKLIASGSWDNTVKLWDIERRTEVATLKGHGDDVNAVAFNPDGRLIASGSRDGTVKLWDVKGRKEIATQFEHWSTVLGIAFSPDGELIASSSRDGTIKLWDVERRTEVATLKGHTKSVNSVAFSPDGELIASSSRDGTIKLWDVERRTVIGRLWRHGSSDVCAVDFSPDGELLASGSWDNTVKLWDLSGSLIRELMDEAVASAELSASAISQSDALPSTNLSQPAGAVVSPYPTESGSGSQPTAHAHLAQLSDVDVDVPNGRMLNMDAVAVVIGNRDYTCTDVPAVQYAGSDARTIKQYLVDLLGYRGGNILYVENATGTDMRSLLGTQEFQGRLGNIVKPNVSDVCVYYSGHGAPDPNTGKGYFLPVDCCPNDVRLNGYPLETFYDNMVKLSPRSLTVVIDACFSGGSNDGMIIQHASPLSIEIENPAMLGSNRVQFSSSGGNEISSWYPEKKHSLFTYFFLKGLRGDADSNQDKKLTSQELFEYLSDPTQGVPYYARSIYNGRVQTPSISGDSSMVLVEYQ